MHVTRKGLSFTLVASATPIDSGVETARTISLTTSVEVTPIPSSKRPHLTVKEKEKADSRSFTV